jgi:Raf kinase inhibitor-like YbhB/YbcL family protein
MAERRRRRLWVVLLLVIVVIFLGAGLLVRARLSLWSSTEIEGQVKRGLTISSSSFANGGMIPAKYTCDGATISPQITISATPENARSLAIIVDDSDTPFAFVHWIIFNLPATLHELPEGASPQGTIAGRNDFDKNGYGGPCPPAGKVHHYVFHIYALDTTLSLPEGASRAEVARAAKGHVLATGVLTGLYGRGQ